MKTIFFSSIIISLILLSSFSEVSIDKNLRKILSQQNINRLTPPPKQDSLKVELGRMLFFDKILSGNKDISCATCHHPQSQLGDGLTLSIGVGGSGIGAARKRGKGRLLIPRNSPEIFNRGAKEWHTMFWDSRVSGSLETGYDTPADEKLPNGLENLLAVQAMFPIISRDEMRGEIGDLDINGEVNELALISNASPQSIWQAIMRRLLAIPVYQDLFKRIYPHLSVSELGFHHAANAIAAFEMEAFALLNSPWDQYLAGDNQALDKSAKRGALLFYGKASCGTCHSGNLMTDQKNHNLAIPQFGPGKGVTAPLDMGHFTISGKQSDRFAFRTPPLRNVTLTGPWMHNGAYDNLEAVIKHHLQPQNSLAGYNSSQLGETLKVTFQSDDQLKKKMLDNLSPNMGKLPRQLNQKEVEDLLSFLYALTDSSALHLEYLIPTHVPSGLEVDFNRIKFSGSTKWR